MLERLYQLPSGVSRLTTFGACFHLFVCLIVHLFVPLFVFSLALLLDCSCIH